MRNESGYDSFLADSTNGIAAGLRVKFSGVERRITPCAASEHEIAITKNTVLDNKTLVDCRLSNAPGNVEVEVNGAYSRGQIVKRDAAGKVAVEGAGTDFGTVDSEDGTDQSTFVIPL